MTQQANYTNLHHFFMTIKLFPLIRSQRHPFERVPTPFQVYSWMAPNMEHTIDSIRAEDGK